MKKKKKEEKKLAQTVKFSTDNNTDIFVIYYMPLNYF